MEQEIAFIEEEMCSRAVLSDYQLLRTFHSDLERKKKELEDVYREWLILSE